MRLNKVILSNIGAYHGHYEIDLSIDSPKRKLILFGGKNGAGKTTLLDSIRLALFGPYTYGFRTENEQYFNKIKPMLNKTAVNTNENLYRIILEFDRVEDYQRNSYTIKRSWRIDKNKIKETFEVLKDGMHLNERESEIFQSRLREETPPQLYELCLFDGEEISRIITDQKLSDYIRNSARVLFSLDLFENLEQDINQYMKQTSAEGKKSEHENELEQFEKDLTIKQNEYNNLHNERSSLYDSIEMKQNEVDHLKKEFEIHGGLVKDERDQLLKKINEIEYRRKINSESIRSFITGLLPIYLVRNLLTDVQQQMISEKEIESYDFVSKSVDTNQLTNLASKLKASGLSAEINNEKSLEQLLLDEFLTAIKPDDSSFIHRASFNQRTEIETILNELKKLDKHKYIDLYSENQSLLSKLKKLKNQVEDNDKNQDFKELFDKMQELNQQIEQSNVKVDKIDQQLINLNEVITKLNTDHERIKTKLIESTKSETTLSLSLKISEVSKKFRSLQLKKKLQQVEFEATDMINQLFSKENFIHQVKIDSETFEITLLSSQQEEIDQHKISAGEKELLLLSVIWAMFKTSGSRMPFIFDTLLGRLDKTHRERLLTKLIPNFGEQIIILSTDSEIDKEHFELIEPILSKTYTLNFDEENQKVQIQKGKYFDLSETEWSK
ncbi:DNA sulfur modification protein DndD [Salipaludibacillus daqingensis]|uniref:DNA sulfur modification protein DndD n=1 Tax=Salipaludibacillus daqingensis TaxID=3041001 RepID=UPI00247379B2|nr:DNA sulfur modification protein DndD [Salipaludibacillus daqingensis]